MVLLTGEPRLHNPLYTLGVSLATVYNILSGRAQNPQTKTIKALEKVLGGPFESTAKPAEPAIEGIGELVDFDPWDPNDFPTKGGVYVLYDISQRPIYVGKGANISERIKDHGTRFWFKRPLVELGSYVVVGQKLLRDQIETVLIQFLKNNAVINKQKTVRGDD